MWWTIIRGSAGGDLGAPVTEPDLEAEGAATDAQAQKDAKKAEI